MDIKTPEDVLRLMAEDIRKSGDSISPHSRVDLAKLIGLPIPKQVQGQIRAAESCGWIERRGHRWRFTPEGIDKLHDLEQEAGLGRVERYLRSQRRKRPLVWRVVVPILNTVFALAALIISIIALLKVGAAP